MMMEMINVMEASQDCKFIGGRCPAKIEISTDFLLL
jgi:hypothetical protein